MAGGTRNSLGPIARGSLGAALLTAVGYALLLILWPLKWRLLAFWLIVEAIFYIHGWLPRYERFNKAPAVHEPTNYDAMKAWQRFVRYCKEVPGGIDYKAYLQGWYRGMGLKELRRGNAEEFVAYGFWYTTRERMQEQGLGHIPAQMVHEMEEIWGIHLEEGYNHNARFLGHLWEPLNARWLPLAFYLSTEAMGFLSSRLLQHWGFHKHTHNGFSYFTLNLTKPAPKAVLPSSSSSLTGFNTASAGSTRSSSSGAAGGVHPTAADKGSDGGVQSVGRPHLANASPVAATPTQPASDAVSTPAALSPVGEAEEQSDLEPQLSGFECISFMGGVPVSVGCDNTAPSVTASTTNPVAAGRMDLQSTAEAAAAAAASTAGAIPLEAGLQEAASVRLPVTSSTSFFNMPEGWSPFATAVAGGVCSSKPCGGSVNESDTTTSRIPSIQDQCNTAGGPCSAASTGQPVLWHHQHGSMYIRSAGPCATPCLSHLCSKTSELLATTTKPLQQALSVSGLDDAAPGTPVLFLHGVAGLPAYLELVLHIMAAGHPVLAVEMQGVSLRLSKVWPADDVGESVVGILDRMGVEKAAVVAHSYGTFIASLLLKRHPHRVSSVVLVDPVCFGMFLPNLLHSFFYKPLTLTGWGATHLLDFVRTAVIKVAAVELHLCTAFSRQFYWTDLNLWPEELPGGSVVLLSGKDPLVSSEAVRQMLEQAGHVQVMYNEELAHGEFLLVHEVKALFMERLTGLLAASGDAVAGVAKEITSVARKHTGTLARAFSGRESTGRRMLRTLTSLRREVGLQGGTIARGLRAVSSLTGSGRERSHFD